MTPVVFLTVHRGTPIQMATLMVWMALVVLFQLFSVTKASVCYYGYYHFDSSPFHSYYCDNGCCGYYYSRHCCVSGVEAIVGSVFGGLFVIVLIVIIIIICRRNRFYQRRQVIQSNSLATMASIHHVTSCQPAPQTIYAQAPPPYSGPSGTVYLSSVQHVSPPPATKSGV